MGCRNARTSFGGEPAARSGYALRMLDVREPVVGVFGAGDCDAPTEALAHEVGRLLARAGCVS